MLSQKRITTEVVSELIRRGLVELPSCKWGEVEKVIEEYEPSSQESEDCPSLAFDHSFGVLHAGGIFFWKNRRGGKTFINSNRNGRTDYLIITAKDSVDIICDNVFKVADEEHGFDGRPNMSSATMDDIESLVEIVVRYCNREVKTIDDFDTIKKLLTPRAKYGPKEVSFLFRNASSLPSEFERDIRKMSYSDFLQTPYWKIVSDEVKRNHHFCQLCGSENRLEVHHTTYNIHGREINNLEKLTVLCHDCHEKISD